MDELFELTIKERRYLRNLSEGTLHYYREVYNFFKSFTLGRYLCR
jgi:hypothetical protein